MKKKLSYSKLKKLRTRFKKDEDELERNRKDFEMLSMFEKKLDDGRENAERFKAQNKRLMMEQLNREKNKLGKRVE